MNARHWLVVALWLGLVGTSLSAQATGASQPTPTTEACATSVVDGFRPAARRPCGSSRARSTSSPCSAIDSPAIRAECS
ncbi:MAG: hypothetical protein U0270_16210 [Labilithrix sp.]